MLRSELIFSQRAKHPIKSSTEGLFNSNRIFSHFQLMVLNGEDATIKMSKTLETLLGNRPKRDERINCKAPGFDCMS
jgi:hypothetical protein